MYDKFVFFCDPKNTDILKICSVLPAAFSRNLGTLTSWNLLGTSGLEWD